MDFRDTLEEANFRMQLREWLDSNVPEGWWESQFDQTLESRAQFRRDWQARMFEGRWVGITWPSEYGGRDATIFEQAIFSQELARSGAPRMVAGIGIGMVGPTIIAHGTKSQKDRYLRQILSAGEIWCQGFSEPSNGSDLAGLHTSAIADGDDFVINGQKVWTTNAHIADWCMLLARTNPDAPKHGGLTCFLVDMHLPGIEVRPLRQLTGEAEFNEIFFDNVRISRDALLGDVNRGWNVAMTTLMNERTFAGYSLVGLARHMLDDLIDLTRRLPRGVGKALDDPAVRQGIAALHVEVESARLTMDRAVSRAAIIGEFGPEGSIAKLTTSETLKRITDLALEVLGPAGLLANETDRPEVRWWQHQHLLALRASTIAGGTSEIMRNIIAERVVGLPRAT